MSLDSSREMSPFLPGDGDAGRRVPDGTGGTEVASR
jgi:hypothetical protein